MTAKLGTALVAAQKEMPAIKPNAVNPHFRNQYVTLGHLLAKALPVLNKHGIALIQLPSHNELGHPTLTTRLQHESGEFIEQSMPLFLPKNDPQGQGSALTYARRYAAAAALGISDEDDDGEAASRDVQAAAPSVRAAAPSGRGAAPAPPTPDGVFRFGSGKYEGKTLAETPASYLDWYVESGPKQDVKDAIAAYRAGAVASPADPHDDDIPFDRKGF